MSDLTSYERRLALAALWNYRNEMGKALTRSAEDSRDAVHEIDVVDACDSAARKLGGDPTEDLYGAAHF